MLWAWTLWLSYALGKGPYYALVMDVVVIACSWNTRVIMFWHRLLSSSALEHGRYHMVWISCCGYRMLLEHEL